MAGIAEIARWLAAVLLICACNSNYYRTRAFSAGVACGQGPYEVHVPADGTTAEDGIEVVACTPRELAGHVQVAIGSIGVADEAFGGSADNGRCVGGGPVVATAADGAGGGVASAGAGGGSAAVATQAWIEQPFDGDEKAWGDELCKPYRMHAQQVLMTTTIGRYKDEPTPVQVGTDMRVRIWSDAPNDLSGVVFLVRQARSSDAPKTAPPPKKVADEPRAVESPPPPPPPPSPPSHGPPPAPLAESRPPKPTAVATWVPGYWTWTGADWGWVAGFWRDAAIAAPPPPPSFTRAGEPVWIWIGGRWRR